MKNAHIAIVSANKDFLRFFSLEASHFGLSSLCGSHFVAEMKECRGVILDAEEVSSAIQAEKILLISHRFSSELKRIDESREIYQLSWPCSVAKLKTFLLRCQSSTHTMFDGGARSSFSAYQDLVPPMIYFEHETNDIRYRNQRITLSDTEKKLLLALCQESGRTVSRAMLDQLLGCEKGNLTDVYICHLRNKLEKPFSVRLIETIRGQGYRICTNAAFWDQEKEDAL